MEFQKIIERAVEIRKQYEEKEKQLYGSSWTSEEIALWDLLAMLATWQNLSSQKTASAISLTAGKSLSMNWQIVYGQ